MTEIRVDEVYVAESVKTGENEHGPWEIVVVKGPGKRQARIGISVVDPPSGIGINGAFRVDEIRSVMVRNYKNANGYWTQGGSVTVRARIIPANDWKPKKEVDDNFINTQFPSLEDYFK